MNICNKCGAELEEDHLINGCPKCGSKLFKFVNTKNITKKNQEKKELDNSQEKNLSSDSIESIKIEDKGVYELNLHHILEGETNVFSDNDGNYAIDINSLLQKGMKNRKLNENSKK